MERFRGSSKGILIAVRMLDESVNLPDLQLIVDLNTSSSIRQFLQRMGRLLRLSERKADVDFISFQRIDQDTALEMLNSIKELVAHSRITERLAHSREVLLRLPPNSPLQLTNEESWSRLENAIYSFWERTKFPSYEEARRQAQLTGIKSHSDYKNARKDGRLSRLPASPQRMPAASVGFVKG